MAVRVLPHTPAQHAAQATSLPVVVLALALVPAALDLLKLVQPVLAAYLALPDLVAGCVAASVLLLMWVRFPRTSWLAAASLAAVAGVALRLTGAELAPLLSLLAIVAVGVGGGYANPEPEVTPAGV